jgi:hypothetical protein
MKDIFLDFVLHNIKQYTNIVHLLATTSTSIKQINVYYTCHIPKTLPFPESIIDQNNATTWEKYTHDLFQKCHFRDSSYMRMQMCVLMDFLKVEKSSFTLNPNIKLEGGYSTEYGFRAKQDSRKYTLSGNNGISFRLLDHPDADSDSNSDSGTDSEHLVDLPIIMLYGVIFSEDHYIKNRATLNCVNYIYEEFHIVKSLNHFWVIIIHDPIKFCIRHQPLIMNFPDKIPNNRALLADMQYKLTSQLKRYEIQWNNRFYTEDLQILYKKKIDKRKEKYDDYYYKNDFIDRYKYFNCYPYDPDDYFQFECECNSESENESESSEYDSV